MPEFSKISLGRLATCDERLQRLFHEVIKTANCSILCGHRNEEDQEKAFHDGKSEKRWPGSLHNRMPSLAVDVAPYPIEWENSERFYAFSRYVATVAKNLGMRIRAGADWNGDGIRNEKLIDLPHFEILE